MKKPVGWSHSLTYPLEGNFRCVTVDYQDLGLLNDDRFLNDNIVNFALRRIEASIAPEHKKKVLFFNTFFYTALMNGGDKEVVNYNAVKKWTKNNDIFRIPYIVVPINIDLHWFVAIICNLPNSLRKVDGLDMDPDMDNDTLLNKSAKEEREQLSVASSTATFGSKLTTESKRESSCNLSLSDADTKFGIDKLAKQASTGRKVTPDDLLVITLDSFGTHHPKVVRNLKDYLIAEAQQKRGMQLCGGDLQDLAGEGLPKQTNLYDCGVYLIEYVEKFAQDPRKFIINVLQTKTKRHSEFADFDPTSKRGEIRNELLRLHDEQDAQRRAKKTGKRSVADLDGSISEIEE